MTSRAPVAAPLVGVPFWPAAAFVLVWSSGYVAGPAGVDAVSPFWVLVLRFAVAALMLYPLAWLVAGVLASGAAYVLHEVSPIIPASSVLAGPVVALLAIAGGMVAVHYLRLLRETVRALRVRLTRARQRVALAELRVERAELADLLESLEEGVDLPGSVTAEGMVLATEEVPPGGKA